MSTQHAQRLLPPPFCCTRSRDGAHAIRVEVTGELDLATRTEFEHALRGAVSSAPLVVLDLHSVTFMDSTGVHAIEGAGLRALLYGRRLVVSRAPAHVVRILALVQTACTVELLDAEAA